MWLAWALRRAAWCRRRGRWCAAGWTSGRGWSPTTSPWSRPCRRWCRSGRPRRWHDVRLLILGGEACPPEIGARLATADREVWNTYGPTEATVVACGAQLTGDAAGADRPPARRLGPRRRRRRRATRSAPGETGELIIGGVGLARYLDPDKDAEKYAAMPTLGWDRAYRSGDLVRVRRGGAGLPRAGRRPGQDRWAPHRARRDRQRAARPPRGHRRGGGRADHRSRATSCSSGTSPSTRPSTSTAAMARLRAHAAGRAGAAAGPGRRRCRPRRPARSTATRCRGRCPASRRPARAGSWTGTAGWVQELWARDPRGRASTTRTDDFFDLGGGSLTAAQLVSRLRERFPEVTVADVYEHPTRRGPGRRARRDGGPGVPHEPSGAPGPAQDPGRPGRLHRSRCGPSPACAGSPGSRAANNVAGAAARPRLAAHGLVVVGGARLAAAGLAAGTDGA